MRRSWSRFLTALASLDSLVLLFTTVFIWAPNPLRVTDSSEFQKVMPQQLA
jgi:hypothetical protein